MMKDGFWIYRCSLEIMYYEIWDVVAIPRNWREVVRNLSYCAPNREAVCGVRLSLLVAAYFGVSYWFTEIGVLNYLAGHFDTI